MPHPKKGETERDYLKRCIPEMIDEGKPQAQSVAICYSMYRREGTEEKSPKPEKHNMDMPEPSSRKSDEPTEYGWEHYHPYGHRHPNYRHDHNHLRKPDDYDYDHSDLSEVSEYGHVRRASRRRGYIAGSHSHYSSDYDKRKVKYAANRYL